MNYDLILFCLTSEYKKILLPDLIESGFEVSSPYSNNITSLSKGISNIINLRLKSKSSEFLFDKVFDIVKNILIKNKIYYYGFIIHLFEKNVYRVSIGNIDGETDITRVIQMKCFW